MDNRPSEMSHHCAANPPAKSADLETNLASADRIISYWDSNSPKAMLFESIPKEANEYLAAVDDLRHVMENLVVTHNSSAKLVRAERLMGMSMTRLEKEFHRILSANVKPTMAPDDGELSHGSSDDGSTDEDDSSSGSHRSRNSNANEICEIDMMPIDAMLNLRSIVKRMVDNGYGSECVRIYGMTRKSVIEECLSRIGVDRLSTSDVQKMDWEILDFKIKIWIRSVKIAVRILFASEKLLCDDIFAGFNHVRDFCFAEVVKGPTMKLLAFGEFVAMCKKSSEMLFRVLDMYESLRDLMPDIHTVYCQESCASVRTQAATIFVRLGESALGIMTVFENAIQAENSKTLVPGDNVAVARLLIPNSKTALTGGSSRIPNNSNSNSSSFYECKTEQNIAISQNSADPMRDGTPAFTVLIINTCTYECALEDIHLHCGSFASTELISPSIFRRIAYDDCLVNDGNMLTAGSTVSF